MRLARMWSREARSHYVSELVIRCVALKTGQVIAYMKATIKKLPCGMPFDLRALCVGVLMQAWMWHCGSVLSSWALWIKCDLEWVLVSLPVWVEQHHFHTIMSYPPSQ